MDLQGVRVFLSLFMPLVLLFADFILVLSLIRPCCDLSVGCPAVCLFPCCAAPADLPLLAAAAAGGTCSAIAPPPHATLRPRRCLRGATRPGRRCYIVCQPGFRVRGRRRLTCRTDLSWTFEGRHEPRCVPGPAKRRRNRKQGQPPLGSWELGIGN